jgi:hypothetical protein
LRGIAVGGAAIRCADHRRPLYNELLPERSQIDVFRVLADGYRLWPIDLGYYVQRYGVLLGSETTLALFKAPFLHVMSLEREAELPCYCLRIVAT